MMVDKYISIFMLSQSSWFAKKRVLSEQDLDGPPIDTNNQKL